MPEHRVRARGDQRRDAHGAHPLRARGGCHPRQVGKFLLTPTVKSLDPLLRWKFQSAQARRHVGTQARSHARRHGHTYRTTPHHGEAHHTPHHTHAHGTARQNNDKQDKIIDKTMKQHASTIDKDLTKPSQTHRRNHEQRTNTIDKAIRKQ